MGSPALSPLGKGTRGSRPGHPPRDSHQVPRLVTRGVLRPQPEPGVPGRVAGGPLLLGGGRPWKRWT
eukprot:4491309-Pyramimonas_sp.AAC.1